MLYIGGFFLIFENQLLIFIQVHFKYTLSVCITLSTYKYIYIYLRMYLLYAVNEYQLMALRMLHTYDGFHMTICDVTV